MQAGRIRTRGRRETHSGPVPSAPSARQEGLLGTRSLRVFLGERTTEVLGTLAMGHCCWIIGENSEAHTLSLRATSIPRSPFTHYKVSS